MTYSRMDQEKFVEDSLEDCSAQNHTLKVSLPERAQNLHKGKTKKNLRLVVKVLTLAKLADLFKTTLIGFLCHQFNVNQASKIHDQTRAGTGNSTIVKNHDSSENYTSFAWKNNAYTLNLRAVNRLPNCCLDKNWRCFTWRSFFIY